MIDIELPEKLSTWIEWCLEDFEKVKADPNYTIDLNFWHKPLHTGLCSVCLGGAVLAKRICIPIDKAINTADFTPDVSVSLKNALFAADSIRRGLVVNAIMEFYSIDPKDLYPLLEKHNLEPTYPVCKYLSDGEEWLADINSIVKRLEVAGL